VSLAENWLLNSNVFQTEQAWQEPKYGIGLGAEEIDCFMFDWCAFASTRIVPPKKERGRSTTTEFEQSLNAG
jgi:hypothetical protein